MRKQKTFFGAANGYQGFRSNFNRIFSPAGLDKLFIIKGGPGTGKSTLMKRLQKHYAKSADVTTVLCSSDPGSLDGLLIKSSKTCVGIVDGTAPHVMEPEYPGAFEEIVNLGDAFDFLALEERKREVIELSDRKKGHYKSAYSSLRLAGNISSYVSDFFLKSEYYISAEALIKTITESHEATDIAQKTSEFLLGAFCKNGYKRLSHQSDKKRTFTIKGDGISEYVLTAEIEKSLVKRGVGFTVFHSAFSTDLPDLIETDEVVYTVSDRKDADIDSTALMPETCEYERLREAYRCFLENAQISLIKASEYHFKLEDIYSNSIAFDQNENKYYDIVKKIDSLFDK